MLLTLGFLLEKSLYLAPLEIIGKLGEEPLRLSPGFSADGDRLDSRSSTNASNFGEVELNSLLE